MTSSIWYNFCTVSYVFALLLFSFDLALRRESIRRAATILTAVGFLLQTLGMVFRWVEAGHVEVAAAERATGEALSGLKWFLVFTQHPPWSNLYEIMVYMSWGLVLVFLVTQVKWRIRFLGVVALLLVLAALGLASLTDGEIKPLVPALKSWWIMIHVISASIAYAAGTIAAVASLFFLIQAKDKISLTGISGLVLAVSAAINLILGRGMALFTEGSYRVKLLKEIDGEQITVGRLVNETFTPYFVESRFVGPVLIATVLVCAIGAVIMLRKRKQDTSFGLTKKLYSAAVLLQLTTVLLIIVNDFTQTQFAIDAASAAALMPPAPWTLGLRSNSWDLALFVILLGGQVLVGFALFYSDAMRLVLPSAEKLDRIAYANIMVSFALVAVVLVTGALWAHYAWGRYWAWDPKETGALVIWVNYALYLHTRMTHGWSGARSAMIGILGFFVILAGFLGVNLGFFATGLHSYGST